MTKWKHRGRNESGFISDKEAQERREDANYNVFFELMLRGHLSDRAILDVRERERIADRVRTETIAKFIAQKKTRKSNKR